MAALFGIFATIVIVGWLWFYIVRPILEDFGILLGVNHSQDIMSYQNNGDYADEQTDRTDRPSVSADNLEVPRLQLDRTKTAIIEVLVYNGWQVGDIRAALKGDNGTLGAEIDVARKRLGILPPDRTLRVRDIHGERVIPFN